MKFLRGLFLAGSLLIASFATGQDKTPKGYDLGSCAPDSFAAAHVVVSDKGLTIDLVSTGPGEVEKEDHPVLYKFQSKDSLGSHYLFVTEKQHKLELALDFKKGFGVFSVDGENQAVILIMADDDGSKLATNAMDEFKACVDLVNGASSNDIKIRVN